MGRISKRVLYVALVVICSPVTLVSWIFIGSRYLYIRMAYGREAARKHLSTTLVRYAKNFNREDERVNR